MSRLRPYPVFALAAWSLFLWTSRLGLAWKTAGSTAGKVLATVPVAIFVALGLALLAGARGARHRVDRALGVGLARRAAPRGGGGAPRRGLSRGAAPAA